MRKIILDTDLGSDCDDCGALAILNNFHNAGKCSILAIMCNIANSNSPVSVKHINSWFGNSHIPIAQTNDDIFKDNERVQVYTKYLAKEYLENNPVPEIEDAVTLYRKLLAQNKDVAIISIGFLNNIAALLNSEPDSISSLNGVELVKAAVSKIYVMGGNFSGEEKTAEYNIRIDIPSAQTVSEKCPVPIVYLGWEIGMAVRTGHTLWEVDKNSPVKKGYEIYANHYNETKEDGTYDRQSWDPLTAYYAVSDSASFMHESTPKTISFDDEGFTHVKDGGKDTFLILDDAKKAEEVIEQMIAAK